MDGSKGAIRTLYITLNTVIVEHVLSYNDTSQSPDQDNNVYKLLFFLTLVTRDKVETHDVENWIILFMP